MPDRGGRPTSAKGAAKEIDKAVDVAAARALRLPTFSFSYTERDAILYALAVGCGAGDARHVYEGAADFAVLPMFGVIPPYHDLLASLPMAQILPNFSPMRLLHGEQYLEVLRPFPPAGELRTTPRIVDMQDKGAKGATVVVGTRSVDAASGELVAVNEITSFMRGAGGFGGGAAPPPAPRPAAATALNPPPERPPDAVLEERTRPEQAALYRLCGDANPLHIDPEFAALGGFDRPILHGLCTFGAVARQLLERFAPGDPDPLRRVKVRFARHVFPGDALVTRAWVDRQEPTRVVFETRNATRGWLALTHAALELRAPVAGQAPGGPPGGAAAKL